MSLKIPQGDIQNLGDGVFDPLVEEPRPLPEDRARALLNSHGIMEHTFDTNGQSLPPAGNGEAPGLEGVVGEIKGWSAHTSPEGAGPFVISPGEMLDAIKNQPIPSPRVNLPETPQLGTLRR
jgi:hypothetical protein